MDGFISTKEAAERLGVSTTRIREMLTTGVMKGQKMGRDWFIPEKELIRIEKTDRKPGRPKKA